MAISVDELNQASDWAQSPQAQKTMPTPTVPPVSDGRIAIPLDEANAFSDYTVTTADAPQSFWKRKFSAAQIGFDSNISNVPKAVGSALIFLGETLRDKNLPKVVPNNQPFLKDFALKLEALPESGRSNFIGESFIRMGFSWQDLGEKLVLKQEKALEQQTEADKYLSDLVSMGTGMAGLIGTALVASPAVAIGAFVGPTTFETYAKAREKDKSYQEAIGIGAAMGIATGTPAMIGLGAILKVAGPLVQRMVTGAVISSVDLGVMRAGSETVERVSGITDSQQKGWDSVKEAVGLAVRDASMGLILGAGTGAVSYGMAKRQEIKSKLVEAGFSEEQAINKTDALLSKGMDTVLKVTEQEKSLLENGIYRTPENDFVDAQNRPVVPEKVLASLAGKDIPLVEQAKVIAAEALPQRETVGVTPAEKAFLEETKATPLELEKDRVARIFDKFIKIQGNLKKPEAITKQKIKAIQSEFDSFIRNSDLEASDKAKFLASIKQVQTIQQLRRLLPEVKTRIDALAEKTNLRSEISRFTDLTKPSNLNKVRAEYQGAIRQITENLSTTRVSVPKAMALESLAKHLQNEPNSIIPQYKLDELTALDKKSLRDMTSEQVKTINDAITHLYKLEELKSKILERQHYVSLEKTIGEVLQNIQIGSKQKVPLIETGLETIEGPKEKIKNFFGLDSRDAETNLMLIEGKDGGKFQKVVFGNMNQAKTDYLKFVNAAKEILRRGLESADVSRWSQYITADPKKLDLIPFEFTGGEKVRTVKLTKAQAIAFHLLMQREEGATHLLEGGFSIRGKLADVIRVTADDAEKISNYVLSDPEMVKVVVNLDAYFNGFQKQAINRTAYNLTGLEIANTPNYFRIVVDPYYRKTAIETKKYSGKVAIEGLGFLKETVPSKIPVILEDAFQVAYESMHLAGSYVAYAEPLRAAKEVLNDGRVKRELVRNGREADFHSLERYIQRVEGEIVNVSNLEALSKDLLVKIQTSVLMLNPGILLKQPTSIFAASTEMEIGKLVKNYKLAPTKEEVAEIKQWSPQLAARWEGHITRELGELKNAGQIEELFTGRVGWTEKFMQAYQTMDHPMITTIWRTAKEEVTKANPDLKGHELMEKVAERAEFVVRRTQASVFVEHRSENLARREMWMRGVTLFSSETNKQFAMVTRAIEQFNRSDKSFNAGLDLTKKLFVVSYLNAILIATINAGANIWKQSVDKGRKDEEKKDWELISKKFFTDVILGPLGMVYGARDLANIVQSELVYGDVTHEINNPVTSLATDIGKGIGDLVKSGGELLSGEKYKRGSKKKEEKWTTTLGRGIMELVRSIGAAKGIPVNNTLTWGGPMFAEVGKFFGIK